MHLEIAHGQPAARRSGGTATRSPSDWCQRLPFLFWTREGFSTKIGYRKKGTLILTSLLDLGQSC